MKGRLIFGKMFLLATDRLFPLNAKPFEIGVDAGFEFGCTTRQIDVFDTQQQPAVCGLGHVIVQESRQRVTEMQRPIGARGETEDGFLTRSRDHAFFWHGFEAIARQGAGHRQ